MAVLNDNALVGASGQSKGYQVSRSLRFNAGDTPKLTRVFGTPSSTTQWTYSAWIKRVKTSTNGYGDILLATLNPATGTDARLAFLDNDTFYYLDWNGGQLATTSVYRDFSAWLHLVFVYDSANATSTDRLRLYINGTRITSSNGLSSVSYPSLNATSVINGARSHTMGAFDTPNPYYMNAYLADVWFLDGVATDASSFGETDATTGQWIPKAYTGSKGTNGFHLEFADNSNNTASTLGKDSAGSNNWTPNNFSVLTGAGNNGNWRNKLSNITYYSGSGITQWDEHLFRGVADNSGYSGYSGFPSDVTWTPATPISYTSSVRFLYDSYPAYTKYTLNGGAEQTTNGSWPPPAGGYQWQTVATGSGTLTSLRFRATSYTADIHAIEVDGVILKDINAAGCDSTVDTPTSYGTDTYVGGEVRGNYCTLNPLANPSGATLSNGNLDWSSTAAQNGACAGTIYVSSGKWYWEVTDNSGANALYIGITKSDDNLAASPGTTPGGYYYIDIGSAYTYNNNNLVSYGSTWASGDVIGVALNMDAGTLVFYKNGVSQGTAFTGLSGAFAPSFGDGGSSTAAAATLNAGQRPFAYTAPSGFKALVDTNLTAPVVAKPNTVFDAVTYDGNSSTKTVTGYGFSPDFVWIKCRNQAEKHALYDQVRGVKNILSSNLTSAEIAETNGLSSFNSNGYTLDNNGHINYNGYTYVGWAWDAGSSTVTNNVGSITSSVRANASAGFSIVTYTGNGSSGATVGHGLGVTPQMVVLKQRTGTAESWRVYHVGVNDLSKTLYLNQTVGAVSNTERISGVSSTTFTLSTGFAGVNASGDTYVAYCFAPVAGYSSFGSYTGNGATGWPNADGPFVYLGFRPKFILWKCTSQVENWVIYDSVRETYNFVNDKLLPNSSAAESTNNNHEIDFLSNGFKVRNNNGEFNQSSGTYIYAAFAESPFQYARAR